MRTLPWLAPLALAGCACGADYVVDQTYVAQAPMPAPAQMTVAPTPQYATHGAAILVLESHRLDRPSEVVGVVDIHVPVGDHDTALAALKEQAAAMGADAVVGAEFHHGEGAGEPIHVSGMAVRFVQLY